MKAHQLGRISVRFEGEDDVTTQLREEFGVLPEGNSNANVVCSRVGSVEELGVYPSRYGRIHVSDEGYRIDAGNWAGSVVNKGGRTRVQFALTEGSRKRQAIRRTAPHIQRLANWNYLSVSEDNAKSLVYGLLDQALQIEQLEAAQTFLHCSAIEKDGDVTVIAGWGGVGKTSSVMDLVNSEEFRFLSDDLGIVAADGSFYRSPKRIQIYPYNLVDSISSQRNLFSNRKLSDRMHWQIRQRLSGAKGVRRRVSAEEFFGPSAVAQSGQIKNFVHLDRGNFAGANIRTSDSQEMAWRSSQILIHELEPLGELGAAIGGAGRSSNLEIGRWRSASESVIASALAEASCYHLQIPETTKPQELSALIRNILA